MTHVLVTGASGGIGAAICKALALRGVTVVLHYHSDRAAAEATRQAMKGGGHSIIQGDLGNPTSIECLWQEASALQRRSLLPEAFDRGRIAEVALDDAVAAPLHGLPGRFRCRPVRVVVQHDRDATQGQRLADSCANAARSPGYEYVGHASRLRHEWWVTSSSRRLSRLRW